MGNYGRPQKSVTIALVADEEAIQLKRERLAIETQEYFWHTCPELTARWKAAMLRLPSSVLSDLAIELQGLELVTKRASLELGKAHAAAMDDDVPVEDLLDRALASMVHLSEAADTMTRLLDELLKT